MVNQTPISVRINNSVLDKLNKFCSTAGAKKNRVINRALDEYITLIGYLTECAEDGVSPMIDQKVRDWIDMVSRRRGSWWWWHV